ncbi:MAG: hypothetical protein ACOX2L_08345 [Anaerolineae bacterium]
MFEGQGGHYLRLFALLSVLLFVVTTFIASLRSGMIFHLDLLLSSRWIWLYAILFATPLGLGLHYWRLLRGEKLRVTDEYMERISHWGYEKVRWAEVQAYRKQVLPLREMRLGRVSRMSRWLTRGRVFARIPPYAYDLVSRTRDGEQAVFRIEPGNVDDLEWLLALIQQHVGAPEEE